MTKSVKYIIITFVLGCFIFLIGSYLQNRFQFNSLNDIFISFAFYQLYTFVLGYSNMFFFEYMDRKNWKPTQYLKRIIAGILGSTCITLIELFFLRAVTDMMYYGYSFKTFLGHQHWQSYQFGLWVTLSIVTGFHVVFFYNRYQQNKLKEQKVIAGTASAKFDALKNQLDPHFLFNSLNVLSSLIEENPINAQKFTTGLSKVYRYVLEQKNKELVTVSEELKFAKTYMSLLKMRFEDSIVFSMPETVQNPESRVVPLSLQLLLENAVKHNTVNSSKPLNIKIYESNGYLIVQNNLQPKQIVKKSTGVGLNNIKQRYALLTSKNIIINQHASSFAVSLPMLTKKITIMNTQQTEVNDQYLRARNHVNQLKGFYYNLLTYCLVIPFLIFVNYNTFWGVQWFWFPMFGWGIGLSIQAYRVFVNQAVFGRNWEKRKMEEFMRNDRNL
ncbi:histidine kinase [Algibacter pacificus]|uniref:histidine kinase n=1 Tax=Algibacter pacificus TaxID=2599389 RepID=UPI0011C74D57|nr:histidine kinase [Algibacter pacificus]